MRLINAGYRTDNVTPLLYCRSISHTLGGQNKKNTIVAENKGTT